MYSAICQHRHFHADFRKPLHLETCVSPIDENDGAARKKAQEWRKLGFLLHRLQSAPYQLVIKLTNRYNVVKRK